MSDALNITQERAAGLRAMADFLEARPDIEAPGCLTLNLFAHTREELTAIVRNGTWTKSYNDDYMWVRKDFGGGITLEINIARAQVCRRVVIGTKVIPAKPEHHVDVVEWICDEASLLAEEVSA